MNIRQMKNLPKQDRARVKEILAGLSELDLKDEVILPHFKWKDWCCESVHGRGEPCHECDVILVSRAHSEMRRGIQLKARKDINTPNDVKAIHRAALEAFNYVLRDNRRLHNFYWITTGKASELTGKWVKERIESDPLTAGRVEIWDIDDLVKELELGSPLFRHVSIFEIIGNDCAARKHEKRGEGVFASLLYYRSFCWHLKRKQDDIKNAGEYIQRALASIGNEKRPQLFYSRALTEFYTMWDRC